MIPFKVLTKSPMSIIRHDLTDKLSSNKKLVPHEWFFINCLYKCEIRENRELANAFAMFVAQFHSDYLWLNIENNNYLDATITEAAEKDFLFHQVYEFECEEKDTLAQALLFGDIVTEFLIRFCNYSLIKCSKQKIIITSRSDCDKVFEKELLEGYSLQRLSKIGYIKLPSGLESIYPGVDGIFYVLPVLPTKQTGFQVEEIIETTGNNYLDREKLENRSFQYIYDYQEYPPLLSEEEWIQRREKTKEYMKSINLKQWHY